ncbi:uncharacterized protein LAESUDRAFT_715367 [Laetiporus sulphureus 93-53]|uniref:Uncharacterized protein n=1 Tax=Laetiporus sulphureus 93-53 TaxID=1314785 RepID=A0A165DGF5_9APHY|nr:uncharacterized protein LAESUDRAFT_715367 [Laetiporus sulphureus 93-53]KZT04833.1 hypothetical protein LAESUDRAFT_715367 [Laetiporus sulphureus 93-53]
MARPEHVLNVMRPFPDLKRHLLLILHTLRCVSYARIIHGRLRATAYTTILTLTGVRILWIHSIQVDVGGRLSLWLVGYIALWLARSSQGQRSVNVPYFSKQRAGLPSSHALQSLCIGRRARACQPFDNATDTSVASPYYRDDGRQASPQILRIESQAIQPTHAKHFPQDSVHDMVAADRGLTGVKGGDLREVEGLDSTNADPVEACGDFADAFCQRRARCR